MPGPSARLCCTLLAIAALASSACGRIHQRSERWIAEESPGTKGEQVHTPLRVHAFRLVVGGEVTPLHDGPEALEAALERAGEGQDPSARVRVPLGDRLVWRDGDVVALEVDATLPWDTAPTTTRRELRAVVEESSGSKLDAFMSQ